MFFIARALFWVGVVSILLPAGSAPRIDLARSDFAVPESVVRSGKAIADAATLCLAMPEPCRAGASVARQVVADLALPSASSSNRRGSVPIPPPRPTERLVLTR